MRRRIDPLLRARREWAAWSRFVCESVAQFKRAAYPGIRVILICRVSRKSQHKRRNLENQELALRKAVEEAGGIVVGIVRKVCSGRSWDWLEVLARAARKAKRNGAILLACRLNRFRRAWGYQPNYALTALLQADEFELQDVLDAADGVQLATLLRPDASPSAERSQETEQGQSAKGNKGGRPLSKAKRNRVAKEMRRQGASVGEIAKRFHVRRSTAQYWIHGVEKGCTKT